MKAKREQINCKAAGIGCGPCGYGQKAEGGLKGEERRRGKGNPRTKQNVVVSLIQDKWGQC